MTRTIQYGCAECQVPIDRGVGAWCSELCEDAFRVRASLCGAFDDLDAGLPDIEWQPSVLNTGVDPDAH